MVNKPTFLLGLALILSLILKSQSLPCNVTQSLSSSQLQQLNPLWQQLDSAMYHAKESKIDSLCLLIKNTLGAQSGLPESSENTYALTTNSNWLNITQALNLSTLLVNNDSLIYQQLWKTAQGRHPEKNYAPHSIFLRFAAETALGLLYIAKHETNLTNKTKYMGWATRALDSLVKMQLPSGAFPFPDLRAYNDPVFSPIIQSFLLACGADSSSVLVNGWIVDDKGKGDFKFDAGVIANAMYQAYLITGRANYKQSCVLAGQFLSTQHLNRNFNYNSFAALGCARAFQLNGDISLLNKMTLNIRSGVFPGQATNGRWFDGHNARSVYHNLMLYHSASILAIIPSGATKDSISVMLKRGILSQIKLNSSCEYSGNYRWLLASHANSALSELHDSTAMYIGRYIQQSAANGKYLDLITLGEYLELLNTMTSINSGILQHRISLYPSPFQGHFTMDGNIDQSLKIEILSVEGKIIKQIKTNHLPYTVAFDESMKAGYYFIRIFLQDGQTATYKTIYSLNN